MYDEEIEETERNGGLAILPMVSALLAEYPHVDPSVILYTIEQHVKYHGISEDLPKKLIYPSEYQETNTPVVERQPQEETEDHSKAIDTTVEESKDSLNKRRNITMVLTQESFISFVAGRGKVILPSWVLQM